MHTLIDTSIHASATKVQTIRTFIETSRLQKYFITNILLYLILFDFFQFVCIGAMVHCVK